MHNQKGPYRLLSKILTGFIYLCFFLVQFNIHLNGSPKNISYFSSDYRAVNYNHPTDSGSRYIIHKESKLPNFKLNKRFHHKNLVTAPEIQVVLLHFTYQVSSLLINEEQPLTNYPFNSPSLRGPPENV